MNNRIFSPARLSLPAFAPGDDAWTKWAVIACDQFTSEPQYWAEAEAIAACGLALENENGRLYLFMQKNKVSIGDRAEVISPSKVGKGFLVTELYDEKGAAIESAPHPNMKFYVRVPFEVAEGDIMRSGD